MTTRVRVTNPQAYPIYASVQNFPATQTVDGSVSVDNFPTVQPVSDNGASLTVDGTVSVGNFPTTQNVADGGGSLTVDGTVSVGNFPVTQPVSGSVTTLPFTPASADVLGDDNTASGTTFPQTLLTIPAGRTWRGSIAISAGNASTGNKTAYVETNGTGVVPSAGTRLLSALTAGTGTANSNQINVYVVAPAGNSVTLRLVNTSSSSFDSAASAIGVLL